MRPITRGAVLAAVTAVVLVATVTVVASRHGRDPRDLPGWRIAWADEFSGTRLDAGRWRVEDRSTFGDGNGELACLMNRPQNVGVSRGELHLTARAERPGLSCGAEDSRFRDGRPYSSAMLSTKGVASWTYGRFEVRARLPLQPGESQGLWPAFWLRPVDGGVGELDVLEAVGTGADPGEAGRVHQTIWYDYSGTHPRQTSSSVLAATATPASGWHTYAVEWSAGRIRWLVDERQVYERTQSTTPWLREAFSRPFYLRLNLAVGGSWPGAPTQRTQLPASFDVDYVRVYRADG